MRIANSRLWRAFCFHFSFSTFTDESERMSFCIKDSFIENATKSYDIALNSDTYHQLAEQVEYRLHEIIQVLLVYLLSLIGPVGCKEVHDPLQTRVSEGSGHFKSTQTQENRCMIFHPLAMLDCPRLCMDTTQSPKSHFKQTTRILRRWSWTTPSSTSMTSWRLQCQATLPKSRSTCIGWMSKAFNPAFLKIPRHVWMIAARGIRRGPSIPGRVKGRQQRRYPTWGFSCTLEWVDAVFPESERRHSLWRQSNPWDHLQQFAKRPGLPPVATLFDSIHHFGGMVISVRWWRCRWKWQSNWSVKICYRTCSPCSMFVSPSYTTPTSTFTFMYGSELSLNSLVASINSSNFVLFASKDPLPITSRRPLETSRKSSSDSGRYLQHVRTLWKTASL